MKNKFCLFKAFSILLFLVFFLSCVSTVKLTPAPGISSVPGKPNIAMVDTMQVRIQVDPNAWTGRYEITQRVTPVKVRIENRSGTDIRFRVNDFAFVDSSTGKHYAALPLHAIQGTIEEPVLVPGYARILSPYFYWDNFLIAPYYAPIYSGITPYDGIFYYDPLYYSNYYTYWRQINLPTQEMYEWALPDGIIKSGGKIEGFLYFEKITSKDKTLLFQANLKDAMNNEYITITIPFVTNSGKKESAEKKDEVYQ